jgi:hypothetical protein
MKGILDCKELVAAKEQSIIIIIRRSCTVTLLGGSNIAEGGPIDVSHETLI